ncbi:MAG TPA: TonB-dependent receptor [Blastocatellia bacterium]
MKAMRTFTRRWRQLMLGWVSLAMLLTLGMPRAGHAQTLYGSIVGNVTDSSGAAVNKATVTIKNRETNLSRDTTTDEAGNYSFPTVQTGSYGMTVTVSGFKTYTRTEIPVTLNTVTRVDVALEVGQVTEAVSVTAEAPLLQTDRAEVRAELGDKALNNLPVTLGRNYQNLFGTLPGFNIPTEAHSVPTNPSRSLRFNVNGVSASINNTRIDGASSTNPWLPHITAYVPSLEAIEVVNVVTSSYDAEQGLAGGAVVNVQIKSGTNQFHGSAFEYWSNKILKARNYFTPVGVEKGAFNYNQYGGTIGGPIKRNKLFFFVSYEGTKDYEAAFRTGSVPTAALRRGDFSASPNPIYDPTTGNADGSGRKAFDNKQIPSNRWDPISLKILSALPLPNLPGETNNLFTQGPFAFDRWTIDSKITYNITSKLTSFFRYSVLDYSIKNSTQFGDTLEGNPLSTFTGITSNAGTGHGNTYNLSVGANYMVTPNLIIDGNFGWVRLNTDSEHPTIGQNIGLDVLGIPGTNGPERYQSGYPKFAFGYTDVGTNEDFMPYYRRDDNYQYVANATWIHGRHEIRGGLDFYLLGMNHIQPEFTVGGSANPRGWFNFGAGPTQIKGGPGGNNFNQFASFLLGVPTSIGKRVLTEKPYSARSWSYSTYLRDRWQVTPKLTLSYGTRYEFFPMATRANHGFELYDLNLNKMLIGGIGSVPEDLGVEVSKTLFGPRLGIAYRPTGDFVLRAGYGITNDPYPLGRPLRTNYPILVELVNNGPNSLTPVSKLSAGIPAVPTPGLDNGVIDIAGNITAITMPHKFNRGYVQSWNVTLQKGIKWGFVGEVGYVATRQIRELGFLDLNWADIGKGSAGQQLFAQFGRTASTRLVSPIGNSTYDAFQARLQRRFRNGYSFETNYTFSKSIALASNVSGSDDLAPIQIPKYYYLNRGVSTLDRPHRLNITNILDVPFGKGHKWLNSGGAASAILGGWQINNLINIHSGSPFGISASGTSLNAPGSSQRADQVKPEVAILGGHGPGQPYFDTTAFAPVTEVRFGTAGPNILRGPRYSNWNFGLFRRFQVNERIDIQFRGEAFNFTNTPHFGNPGNSVTTASSFGIISSASGERFFRFGLRIGF